jgi:hypothetical protein
MNDTVSAASDMAADSSTVPSTPAAPHVPAFIQPRAPATLRSRLPLLIVILLVTALTATCGFYSALGFVEDPNAAEFFPAVLCAGVTVLGIVFFWGLVRDVLPGRTPQLRR